MKKILEKIKKFIQEKFIDLVVDPIDLPGEPEERMLEKIPVKKYLSRNKAIAIADQEKNLRNSMYKEAKKAGYNYGLIEINEYIATLVIIKNKYAWYIKILDGTYTKADGGKYVKGYFDDFSNVSCLVMAETSEYIYLGSNFDTRYFRMTTDDEFLEYIHNVRQ